MHASISPATAFLLMLMLPVALALPINSPVNTSPKPAAPRTPSPPGGPTRPPTPAGGSNARLPVNMPETPNSPPQRLPLLNTNLPTMAGIPSTSPASPTWASSTDSPISDDGYVVPPSTNPLPPPSAATRQRAAALDMPAPPRSPQGPGAVFEAPPGTFVNSHMEPQPRSDGDTGVPPAMPRRMQTQNVSPGDLVDDTAPEGAPVPTPPRGTAGAPGTAGTAGTAGAPGTAGVPGSPKGKGLPAQLPKTGQPSPPKPGPPAKPKPGGLRR